MKDWKLIRSYGMKIIGGTKIFPPITRNASWPVSNGTETLPSPTEKPPGVGDRRPVAVEVEVKNHKRRARSEDIFSYGFPFNAYYSLQKDARLLVGAMPPANEEGEEDEEVDDVFEEEEQGERVTGGGGGMTSDCNGDCNGDIVKEMQKCNIHDPPRRVDVIPQDMKVTSNHRSAISSKGRFGAESLTNQGAYNGVVNICHSTNNNNEDATSLLEKKYNESKQS